MLNPVHIDATNISDAWHQAIYAIFRHGSEYAVQKGSFENEDKRLEFDSVSIRIRNPGERPLIPIIDVPGIPPPSDQEKIDEYLPYLLTDIVQKNETYTYGERINNPKLRVIENEKLKEFLLGRKEGDEIRIKPATEVSMHCNPLEMVIQQYRKGLFGQNQLTMEIGMPSDLQISDPPCLRLIDTKARFDESIGKYRLHFFLYFRSWDLWGGLPLNLAGLQTMKEHMINCIDRDDLVDGEMHAFSKGLHIYGMSLKYAKMLTHQQAE
ncbi:MAG: thymidylate synthase [Nanoarchaeota archaeon]|nr:thymidylate synthase [Nanoarchaeota archaeon]